MATLREKLADSLRVLKRIQDRKVVAIRSKDLDRVHRERLLRNGFLQEVMKGWYIAVQPDGQEGESTAWYAAFWPFCAAYLRQRFGRSWCLSPEQSLSLHAGNRAVPAQLLVRAPKGGNKAMALPYGTSLFDVRSRLPAMDDIEEKDGLRVFSLPAGLIACSPAFFANNATDARAAIAAIPDASELLRRLLEGERSTIAGRLAGAFRNIGRARIADDIVGSMRTAGHTVREHDPFVSKLALVLPSRELSPYAGRIRLLWQQMRMAIGGRFPAPRRQGGIAAYLARVREAYVTDAYHSLSIEGYRVSPQLIERVRRRSWNPLHDEADRAQRDALAARGYWLAFRGVQKSLERVLRGENPGTVVEQDHGIWYREMFGPSVAAGLLEPSDLAGYRGEQVHIRRSMHVPPSAGAVRDAMPVFFEMLASETDPAVRIVLGHFIFVYIHPYMDGNGRSGRFLMNVMMAAAGYPWTVIPVERRDAYMAALEEASVRQNIVPFAEFLARLVEEGQSGKPVARVPRS